jgi:hypothetical protein
MLLLLGARKPEPSQQTRRSLRTGGKSRHRGPRLEERMRSALVNMDRGPSGTGDRSSGITPILTLSSSESAAIRSSCTDISPGRHRGRLNACSVRRKANSLLVSYRLACIPAAGGYSPPRGYEDRQRIARLRSTQLAIPHRGDRAPERSQPSFRPGVGRRGQDPRADAGVALPARDSPPSPGRRGVTAIRPGRRPGRARPAVGRARPGTRRERPVQRDRPMLSGPVNPSRHGVR